MSEQPLCTPPFFMFCITPSNQIPLYTGPRTEDAPFWVRFFVSFPGSNPYSRDVAKKAIMLGTVLYVKDRLFFRGNFI